MAYLLGLPHDKVGKKWIWNSLKIFQTRSKEHITANTNNHLISTSLLGSLLLCLLLSLLRLLRSVLLEEPRVQHLQVLVSAGVPTTPHPVQREDLLLGEQVLLLQLPQHHSQRVLLAPEPVLVSQGLCAAPPLLLHDGALGVPGVASRPAAMGLPQGAGEAGVSEHRADHAVLV